MTASLFEKYEIRRKKYKPGTIWLEKCKVHTVKKLIILSNGEVQPDKVYKLYTDNDLKNNVTFKVLESSHRDNDLDVNKIVSWSKDYMENNYEPLS
jgi:hypothetical protein